MAGVGDDGVASQVETGKVWEVGHKRKCCRVVDLGWWDEVF